MAEADGGSRIGAGSVIRPSARQQDQGAGADRAQAEPGGRPFKSRMPPVFRCAGATVEAAETQFRTHDTTGADGSVTLHIPADAQVGWVVGPSLGPDLTISELR